MRNVKGQHREFDFIRGGFMMTGALADLETKAVEELKRNVEWFLADINVRLQVKPAAPPKPMVTIVGLKGCDDQVAIYLGGLLIRDGGKPPAGMMAVLLGYPVEYLEEVEVPDPEQPMPDTLVKLKLWLTEQRINELKRKKEAAIRAHHEAETEINRLRDMSRHDRAGSDVDVIPGAIG